MLVSSVSAASLHSSLQYQVDRYCTWVLRSGIGQVSLPVTCQAASITKLCHGVGQVSQAGHDPNSCPPDLEFQALTKWLASPDARASLSVLQASLQQND
jgi:hypothetical protein